MCVKTFHHIFLQKLSPKHYFSYSLLHKHSLKVRAVGGAGQYTCNVSLERFLFCFAPDSNWAYF